MGYPTTPQDAAPAYDDVFADHPVNKQGPSRSTSAYAAVPQEDDDVELGAHDHVHSNTPTPAPVLNASEPETFVQTIANVFRPKQGPHVHCEQCDKMMTVRLRREAQQHCCTMTSAVFIAAFICIFFGVVLTSVIVTRARRHN
ncbi:hypothetical protein IQ07DRAFT_598488 [Pyrenochaeta sp. DS3sAY3a]|nr:hypothetical protein IQ07DRAFT_598488 [Pyrenochaeta sp. DS3sAY3a]